MPTNIAPAVTAAYTPIVNVPLDGEYCNSQALQAMLLPALNRAEYLRQLLESAPWKRSLIHEDFTGDIRVSGTDWTFDFPWQGTALGNLTVTNPAAIAGSIGRAHFENTSGSTTAHRWHRAFSLGQMSQFRRAVCKFQLGSIATGMGFEFGVGNGSNANVNSHVDEFPGVSVSFLRSASTNIRGRSWDGTNQTFVDTGFAMPADTEVIADLRHNGAGAWTLSINGGVAVAISLTLPSLSSQMNVFWRFNTPNSGLKRQLQLDFIRFELEDASRVV
jgi:hypothetical protein